MTTTTESVERMQITEADHDKMCFAVDFRPGMIAQRAKLVDEIVAALHDSSVLTVGSGNWTDMAMAVTKQMALAEPRELITLRDAMRKRAKLARACRPKLTAEEKAKNRLKQERAGVIKRIHRARTSLTMSSYTRDRLEILDEKKDMDALTETMNEIEYVVKILIPGYTPEVSESPESTSDSE